MYSRPTHPICSRVFSVLASSLPLSSLLPLLLNFSPSLFFLFCFPAVLESFLGKLLFARTYLTTNYSFPFCTIMQVIYLRILLNVCTYNTHNCYQLLNYQTAQHDTSQNRDFIFVSVRTLTLSKAGKYFLGLSSVYGKVCFQGGFLPQWSHRSKILLWIISASGNYQRKYIELNTACVMQAALTAVAILGQCSSFWISSWHKCQSHTILHFENYL